MKGNTAPACADQKAYAAPSVMDFYMGPNSYEGPSSCAWFAPTNGLGNPPKLLPIDPCDLIDLVAQDEWLADLVADAICHAPALGDIKISTQDGKTPGEYFEKVALIENEARDSEIDLATTRKVIDRLLAEAQVLLNIDHSAVMEHYRQATERLMEKLNAPLPAEIQRELDELFQAKAKPGKPQDAGSELSNRIDKKMKNVCATTPQLDLEKQIRNLCDIGLTNDDLAQAYLGQCIADKTALTKTKADKLVERIVKEKKADDTPERKTGGNIINQDDHKDQVSYARGSIKKANEKNPTMFRYGTENGKIEHVPEEGTTSVSILDGYGVRAEVNACTNYQSINANGDVRGVSTPMDVVSDLMQEQLPIPYLRGVSTYPQFDGDGTFLATNGYHESAYLFMQLPDDLVMPALSPVPTREEVAEAIRLLVEEWLADFAFDGYSRREILVACGIEPPRPPEAARDIPPSLVNFIGFLLQIIARPIIGNHPVPATLITKPEAGTGATLLVNLAQLLITGRTSNRTIPSDDDEMRKEVLAALRGGDPFLFLDNVTGSVDSPVLAALLTSTMFTGRILGRSEEVSVPNDTSTIITGNNPKFTRELQRRLSLIRLDAGVPNPEKRDGWHHDDIEEWIGENRGQLLWALATLVMHWQAQPADDRKPEGTPLGSYRAWYNTVGGILTAAGLKGFQSNRNQIEQVAGNDDDDPMRELVAQWYDIATTPGAGLELAGVYAKELAALADAREIDLPVKRHMVDGERIYNHNAFGKYLGTQDERVFAVDDVNLRIESGKKTKSGKPWELVVLHDE